MQRAILLVAAAVLALGAADAASGAKADAYYGEARTDAQAGRRLAVGMAAGFEVPPGYAAVPVFTRPVGSVWRGVDTSLGTRFREPIYDTPRGYRYWYVRGYTLRRVADYGYDRPVTKRVYVKKAAAHSRPARRHRGACVTDIGYGRHEYCNWTPVHLR
jgi:hypothetical protein